MESPEALTRLWHSVRPILLPYDGMASQVYVLSVPHTELERVTDEFCKRALSTLVKVLDGFAPERGLEFNAGNRANILTANELSILIGNFDGGRSVLFYIWPHDAGATFDAEFVFFADEFFDEKHNEPLLIQSFGLIYSLAEMVRENHPDCECVLSGNEVGDPAEERHEDWTFFW
jgi:hypothetical protein